LGNEDGIALRELIEGDLVPKLKIKLDIDIVSGLQTAMVWGTLPGQTDETIYVMAHRDGFFDAAGDNAAGVASMIELAEYYAGIPAEERRRTLIFIGLDGHHNSGPGFGVGRMWLAENHENLFDKTALLINAEHPSTVQTIVRPRYLNRDEEIIWSNSYTAFHWYAGGSTRPELNRIALNAFREFGISTYLEPNPRAPAGDLSRVFQYVPGLTTTDYYHYFHSELETVETVPWTGLQNTTKAYARIIDEVNKLDLDVLKRPPGTGLDQ
ncbi:MAG TPA: M28 family peptidase, partial [Gammaproteobacteria bacterium]|nr:M28 family peptidase [Gammaproteobacteria bacterium]